MKRALLGMRLKNEIRNFDLFKNTEFEGIATNKFELEATSCNVNRRTMNKEILKFVTVYGKRNSRKKTSRQPYMNTRSSG